MNKEIMLGRVFVVFVAAVTGFHGACTKDGIDDFNEHCFNDSDCDSRICLTIALKADAPYSDWCSQSCSGDSGCPEGFLCRPVEHPNANMACVPPCDNELGDGYACVNGVPALCSQGAYGTYCSECDDCAATDYCEGSSIYPSSDQCLPKKATGQPCDYATECQSGECDYLADDPVPGEDQKVCVVPVGSACTDQNCQYCVANGQFCTKNCSGGDCGSGNVCWGSDPKYICAPTCDWDVDCPDGFRCLSTTSWDYPYVCYIACNDYGDPICPYGLWCGPQPGGLAPFVCNY
jgi:hypothetical protein